MRYLITGTTSGIGKAIKERLDGEVTEINRSRVNLDDPSAVKDLVLPEVDCVILNAGHDLGGGVPFTAHDTDSLVKVLNCNLVSNVILCQKVLRENPKAVVVFITSTNLNKQYANNLVYNLSKLGMKNLLDLIKIDFPDVNLKEARIGLTKTQFNANRHRLGHKPVNDLYAMKHLKPEQVAEEVFALIKSDNVFKEINAE